MKIEKLNEHQLKITLAPEDLSVRGLQLSELSYGSPKVRTLYNELLEQAASEFGFENEDGSLVIEAMPTPKGNLIIFITKNPNSEDIDTRLAKFFPDEFDDEEDDNDSDDEPDFIPFSDLIKNMGGKFAGSKPETNAKPAADKSKRIFIFDSLDALTALSVQVKDLFSGKSAVYKNMQKGFYILMLENNQPDEDSFNKVCNLVSEFALPWQAESSNYATASAIAEHFEKIIGSDAISVLASI